eukprot:6199721-Pleurochrysis_carterae.AAC.1
MNRLAALIGRAKVFVGGTRLQRRVATCHVRAQHVAADSDATGRATNQRRMVGSRTASRVCMSVSRQHRQQRGRRGKVPSAWARLEWPHHAIWWLGTTASQRLSASRCYAR